MAAKAKDGDVVAVVNEDAGTVSLGVVHNGRTLIVAQKNLDNAVAASTDASGSESDDAGEGGES